MSAWQRCRLAALGIVAIASATTAGAVPRVPVDGREVLERLPLSVGDRRVRELAPLRAALQRDPRDVRTAVTLARAYVETGRTTGDPRHAGYAEAVLAPWWASPAPPSDVAILRAVLLQRVHRFDAALADLDRLLAENPRNGQAQLTRATILQVQGRFDEARRACAGLRGAVPTMYVLVCEAGVDGGTGRLEFAIDALSTAFARTPDPDAGTRAWVLGTLAELTERAGRFAVAETHFRSALAADPDDQYLLAAYADFLLVRGRAREVIPLLANRGRADGLLLRLAIASDAARSTDAAALASQLLARFAAAARRGDRVHLREEARFALQLQRDPRTALALALDNWQVQKEPADLLILAEAAVAADDARARSIVDAWIARTGLEDIRIAAALKLPGPSTGAHPASASLRSTR
jgi:Tfp pilus assembly protein PilF